MSIQNILQEQIKSTFVRTKSLSPLIENISHELVPHVLQVFVHDHQALLVSKLSELPDATAEDLMGSPLIAQAIRTSIEKVCALYDGEYLDVKTTGEASTVITNDIQTLFKSASDKSVTWDMLKEKTYHEIENRAHPGNNEDRVRLWADQIQSVTDIDVQADESIEVYAHRAIQAYLMRQSTK